MTAVHTNNEPWIVKQVLSGDCVIIREQPKGGPPKEKQVFLAYITSPKLGRRPGNNIEEKKDEPWSWEARELLRKKIVGKEVLFKTDDKLPKGKDTGSIYLGKENVSEALVAEGLVSVDRYLNSGTEELEVLKKHEEAAKAAGKGRWGSAKNEGTVRDIKWTVENPRNFVDTFKGKPVKAVVEHVRDGSTVRALLLPDFYYITLMMSGVRCPMFKIDEETGKPNVELSEKYAEEAKYFTESRLLQRDIEIILESVSNNNFLGSILHPNGCIAEALLQEGFARCVDWSMAFVTGGPEKLRAAERSARERKVRIWKDWTPSELTIAKEDREFTGKVVEVVNGDALVLKLADGTTKKVFLSSIRPPRLSEEKSGKPMQRSKGFRPLYDIPWMFEAREFLRKKLIMKKVNVTVDYIQKMTDTFPEKTCCTITIGGINVAEAMVSKGLAQVVRYRQDDDHRSSHYDELLAAEMKAAKSGHGIHAKKDIPIHRVAEVSRDLSKAKQFLPFLQRAGKMDAVVEFVASGSRLRLYIPRETCLITFLLAGISCPRATRPGPGGVGTIEGEPFGEEALQYTKDLCLQREVEVQVDTHDSAGNFIGYLWMEGKNLSVSLVEQSLATMHFTAERSEHFKALEQAEVAAKKKKEKVWSNYVEEDEEILQKKEEDMVTERKIDYKKVLITEVTSELKFYTQQVDQGPALEQLMDHLRQEFIAKPPLSGAYSPKRGDMCASKFIDGEWYRARIENVVAGKANVFYVDYGNREAVPVSKCASLPGTFQVPLPYAHEYKLACVTFPKDADYAQEAVNYFREVTNNKQLLINLEYKTGNIDHVTLYFLDEEDIAKKLIGEGLLIHEKRTETRLRQLYLIRAPKTGVIEKVLFNVGDNVGKNTALIKFLGGEKVQDDMENEAS